MSKYKEEYKLLLEDLYIKNKKTSREIAKLLQVSQPTILAWLRKNNTSVRNNSDAKRSAYEKGLKPWNKGTFGLQKPRIVSDEERKAISQRNIERHKKIDRPYKHKDVLVELYTEKDLSLADVAKELSCCRSTIGKWLKKFNIERRSKVNIGSKNGMWKGGITSEYEVERIKFSRSGLSQKCFELDNYTCQLCFRSKEVSRHLNAHHVLPFAYCKKYRFELDNLMTLCEECHFKLHSDERERDANGRFT